MADEQQAAPNLARMTPWLVASLVLLLLAVLVQAVWPGSVVAVSIYKASLAALGCWAGYWADRALFPYQRPHTLMLPAGETAEDSYARYRVEEKGQTLEGYALPHWSDLSEAEQLQWERASRSFAAAPGSTFDMATLRRALIVLGCLVCVGLGA